MKGTVYGSTYQRACEKLEEIISKYVEIKIEPKRLVRNKYNMWVEFENGDYWRAVKISENCRGLRNNIAYIDYLIPQDLVDVIIKPKLSLRPFTAYNYYY